MENSTEILQNTIRQNILDKMPLTGEPEDEKVYEEVENTVLEYCRDIYIPYEKKQKIVRNIFNSLRKLDVLQDLIEDRTISEIMINGPNVIFIEKNGKITRSAEHFSSREKLEDVIQTIVSKVNRVVNESSPIVDVRLEDGSRVNIVMPPVALNGPVVTIRKFPDKQIKMKDMIEKGTVTEEAAGVLSALVKAGYNIFISGGTSSGKTTFLNALSEFIPRDERIITIEDSAELKIQGIENLVSLECRNANLEGKNEITMRDLVKSALRMRPDRILVGEVRDSGVIEMINAMNTGHDGSLSTGHANGPVEMLHRMETMALTGMDIPVAAIRSQIASAVDIVVQVARLSDKSRRVTEIDEVLGLKDNDYLMNRLFRIERDDNGKWNLKKTGELKKTWKLAAAGITLPGAGEKDPDTGSETGENKEVNTGRGTSEDRKVNTIRGTDGNRKVNAGMDTSGDK